MRIAGDNWKNIIEAQAQTNKLLREEETKLSKLGRKLYKEELDSQLDYKKQENRSMEVEHSREREFLRAQHVALHDFDNSKRLEDRNIQKLLAKDYEAERMNRVRQRRLEREKEIQEEQRRIQKESEKIQAEKQAQISHKAHLVKIQQEEMSKIQRDKQSLSAILQKEKEIDRRMIQNSIKKLAESENTFREFYRQRQANQEEKMRSFQPVLRDEQAKWDAINRSNREYMRRREEEARQKEKEDLERVKRNKLQVKQELDKQMDFKDQLRKNEYLSSLKEQQQARIEDDKVRKQKEEEVRNKHKKMQDMQRAYESQIKEKRDLDHKAKEMDPRELNINRQLLHRIQFSDKVAFPGVPGAHSSTPSIQKNFDRVFSKKTVNLEPRASYASPIKDRKDSFRTDEFRSRSVLNMNRRETFVPVDTTIHNPITNPIGASLPRVMPGQIAYKGMSSALSRVANSVLNLH